jgi:hypothetical protein
MMNVINIDPAAKQSQKNKEELLEVLNTIKTMIENGEIEEFVCASSSHEGEIKIHAHCKDTLGAVGLFSIGQSILIERQMG